MERWNYRVLRHINEGEEYFSIHEVFYADGKAEMHTAEAADPFGEDIEELKEDYRLMGLAFEKPVLDEGTLEEVSDE